MKEKIHFVIYLLMFVIMLFLAYYIQSYEPETESYLSFDEGYDEGYIWGYDEGYDKGYDWGHEEGYDDGYDEGHYDGYDEGYSEGESNGYYDGATYTCLYFGDVDRAFSCASNGASWYTFVDAYDQYISNIYDDDETRSAIHWSLVSVVISGDATEEEIETVVSAFGEDLFTRNGIILHD